MKVFLITGQRLVTQAENQQQFKETKAFIYTEDLPEKWCELKYHTLRPNRKEAEKQLEVLKAETLPDGRKKYKNLYLSLKK